jgi:NAD(P)-dependent dehydrogenase (short-subunit alcohol dehydrogenase family)
MGGATFVTVSRLDGAFGLADIALDCDPSSGGLAGLTKTARHEWPEVYCKAIDLAPSFCVPHAAAAAVVDELLAAGPTEVGIAMTHRCTLELARTIRRPSSQLINIGQQDVILVTGGARGVTAEVAVALAETYSPTLILTGRTSLPAAEPDWLAALNTESEIKKAISAKLGDKAGPKLVGEHYQRVVAQREIRRTLERIGRTGARVAYLPVNITDEKKVANLLQQVHTEFGPPTVVIHGAGVLADKRIEDLTSEQFDNVYATKVDGIRCLLKCIGADDLKALVLFSSTSARFGRTGQAAYASANEVLNKIAQVESRRRLRCRVVSVNWGPWEGGMVTPALRKVFEAEGVGLIPMLDGAVFLMQELSAAGKAVEVIALGKHRGTGSGGIAGPGGLATTPPPLVPGQPLSGTGPPVPEMSLAFERSVDTATHPILNSHVLDGRAVLPMSLHLEWLAHAALHGNPGLVFHGVNDLRVTNGLMLDGSGPVEVRAFAGKAVKHDKLFVVPVAIRGKRGDGRSTLFSQAEVVLVSALPTVPPADKPPEVQPLPYPVPQVYREMLFHGSDLQGIERIDGMSESAFVGGSLPAPPPASWFQSPLRSSWVADPLVLDVSFQMMILWTIAQHDTGSLPCFAARYRQYRRTFPTTATTIVIRIRRDNSKFVRADIDYLDPDGGIVAQIQDYECIMDSSLAKAFAKNQLASR